MEYLEGCSTAMRHVVRKVATMEGRLVWFGGDSTAGIYFQTSGLVYDSIPPLGLSLQSPIGFI